MMTEAQAKDCWCPFARSLAIGGAANAVAAVNIATVKGEEYRPPCIASACMAWRWNSPAAFNQNTGKWFNPAPEPSDPEEPRGRCGLAGAE